MITKDFTPAPFTVLGWTVADIAAAMAGLRTAGVRFDRFPGMVQDDLGVWTSPSGAHVAWFKDPDVNLLSLTQDSARPAELVAGGLF